MTRYEALSTLDLHVAGRQIGAYRWAEEQLFHLLGGWVQKVPEVSAKLMLDEHSFEFAWHAELWADRLPEHNRVPEHEGRGVKGLTASPNVQLSSLFSKLHDTTDASSTIEKLAVVYRVVIPRLVVEYSLHESQISGNDATQRALRLIIADEKDAWAKGETQILSLMRCKEDASLASKAQLEAEKLLMGLPSITALED